MNRFKKYWNMFHNILIVLLITVAYVMFVITGLQADYEKAIFFGVFILIIRPVFHAEKREESEKNWDNFPM